MFPIYNLEIHGLCCLQKSRDRRKGLLHSVGAEMQMQRWSDVHFTSVRTDTDGACGLHGQLGWPVQGILTYAGGGFALRKRFVENQPSTFNELRNRADINVLLLEDIENMFWEELTVPALEGTAHTEGHICWRHLQGKHPDVAARAVAFHAAHQDLKTQAEDRMQRDSFKQNSRRT
jgi:hypothetical protein